MTERNLLSQSDLTQWQGMPIFCVEAPEYSEQSCHAELGHILATLDTGYAQAAFQFGSSNKYYSLRAGDIGFFARNQHADKVNWHCHQVQRIIVNVDFSCLGDGDLLDEWRNKPLSTEIAFNDPELTQLLRAMRNEVTLSSPNGALYAQSLSLGVALRLINRNTKRASLNLGLSTATLSISQKQRVIDFLHTNMNGNIKLDQLSSVAGFSTTQFNRLFKKTFGLTPFEYLQSLRLDFVKLKLTTTQIPLAELSMMAGFSSQSHMSTAFLRAYGTSPGRYRRQ